MCTVTYVPLNGQRLLTHSRDEKKLRLAAEPPELYRLGKQHVLFPKDGQAGGSWVALNEHGYALVLLNGAYEKHVPAPPYRKSRGLVFLEMAAAINLPDAWEKIDLAGIEPFTLLFLNSGQLWECRWSGLEKSMQQKNPSLPHIWSSVTLYEASAIARRQDWFSRWLLQNRQPDQESVIDFHLSAGEGDQHNGIRMNRNGEMLTVSVSGIRLTPETGNFRYIDLQAGREFSTDIGFITGGLDTDSFDPAPVLTRNTKKS